MTDWEPATEAEAAMRDALRANDQELYFRVLARTELLLPVSTQALAGQAPMGWGTWTTGGRTHVLAFTSSAALQACLGGNPAASRRSGYADLAVDWPNHEWWLAVNPGLPIEGYLPAWFVSQLSRGDVRLPGRTMGARARLERAENVARTRATAVVPGRDAPASPSPSLPEPSVAGPPPGRPTTEPSAAAEAPTAPLITTPLATTPLATAPPAPVLPVSMLPASVPPGPSYRSPGGAGEPAAGSPYRAGDVAGRPAPAAAGGPDGAGATHTEAAPSGSAWLNVSRRRTPDAPPPTGEVAAGEGGNGRPPEPPVPPAPPASFFEPASGRSRAARPIGEPRRPAERAAPPSRFAGGGQPFPRRRPASDPATEQPPHAFHLATPAEPSTVAFPPAGAAPAASQPEPFRPGGVSPEEATRAFRPDGGSSEEVTRAFRPDGGGSEEVTRAFRPGDVGPGERTQALRTGAVGPGEVTRALRPGEATSSGPGFAGAEDPTRALRPGGGASPEQPRASPQAEPTQAFRPVAPGDEPTRPFGVPGGMVTDEPTRPLGPTGGDEPTRPLGADGAGPDGGLPPRRPGAGAAQAFPRPRPGADGEEPTRSLAEQPGAAPVGETAEELPTSAVDPASGPPASRRSFSPIVIEGTIIEARDLPATGPAAAPGVAPGPSLFGGTPPVAPAPTSMPDLGGLDPVPELDRIDPVSDLGWPAPPSLPDHDQGPPDHGQSFPGHDQGPPGHGQGDLGQGQGEAVSPLGVPAGAGVVSGPPAPDDPGPTAVLFTPSTPPASDPSAESLFRPVPPGHVDPGPAVDAVPTGPLPGPSATGEPGLGVSGEPGPARAGEPVATREPEQTASAALAADFQPANEVEEDLLAAAGTGSTDSFLSTLLLARVLLPVAPDSAPDSRPGDPGFVWRTERLDGETYVVVHTSPERLADHVDEPVETVRVKFVQLIRCWPDDTWSFAVNPNTSVGAKLPGEQIVALANWAAEVGLGDDAGSEPEPAVEAATGAVRHVPPPVDPNRPVVMQKAIAPSQLTYYLERGYDRVSGFVHRANELAHLNSPAQLHDALGLGYPDSPFSRDAAQIYVLRWPAHRPSLYRIPYGGQNEGAMRAMEGWVMERPPFRGNGFAPGDSSDVVAEFKVDSARLPHGAELWRIGADGTERVVAILDTDALLWRQVGES
ncbi:SseB family protein [Micromonospora sp. NBC_01412]|uniref:SseB family protein n=1 Tax=Micromonospora sp. NBC_01412 TaxID=2903590 RepID=UPI00325349E4